MRKFIIIILLISAMSVSSYFLYRNISEDKIQEKVFNELVTIVSETNNEDYQTNEVDILKLQEKNSDIIGWVKIKNTSINYPVMYTKDRPNFYLRKNFYKEYSVWGTPYLSENCNINTSDNLIIYGHHINGHKMFGELEKYKNISFFENHKIIAFYTAEELKEYTIFAVFTTTVSNGFQYYKFINFINEDEFNTFINKCTELSFYDTKENLKYRR